MRRRLDAGIAPRVCTRGRFIWLEKYDWRAREALLNRFPQFNTEIDGLGIHFIHVRSPHPDATPLLVTHGWPGSIVEFQKVIEPLTNPTADGGEAADALHLVCPPLPGYGFSDKPTRTGGTCSGSRRRGPS
jgi:epoxide hydrolase